MSILSVKSTLLKASVVVCCVLSSHWALAAVKEYHLEIAENKVNINGKNFPRITVNGQFPAPQLEFEEGDEAVIHVRNRLKNQDSSIHWHGLLLPGLMDGVPGFNGFKGIKSQQEFTYRFNVRQSGTYWYHAHSMGQEQDGLYGALIIHPKATPTAKPDSITNQDYVVMLSDFHPSKSHQILANLKKDAEYYQNKRETLLDVLKQSQNTGLKATWKDRSMWNQMRMLKTDLSDVSGYTYLVNGKTSQQNWSLPFKPKDKVRLRFINASAMTFYDVRIPHLKMTVVAADGQEVQPVKVDEFRIGNAETYDVIVEPNDEFPAYQIQAEAIDRSGFAIASLQNQTQAQPPLSMPTARPRAILNMADMGHSDGMQHHDAADHANISDSKEPDSATTNNAKSHASMNHAAAVDTPEDHVTTHTTAIDSTAIHSTSSHTASTHTEMQHDAAMQDMNHDQMKMSDVETMPMDHQQHSSTSHQHQQINHEQEAVHSSQQSQVIEGWANASTPIGMKALQYSDLKSLIPQKDVRQPTRELVIRLGGNMERYIWTINGKKFTEATPLKVNFGERVRLTFINDSMMAHPMHLHGMFMQLENGQNLQDLPNKHTLVVLPGKSVSALLTADELGEWAIHCHLLYHMSSGMMSKLVVANVKDAPVDTMKMDTQGASHEHH